jgi:hypothetical protein
MEAIEGMKTDVSPGEGNPGSDIPAFRPADLDKLDSLVGDWEMEACFAPGFFGPDSPAITNSDGRTTFEWLEGRFFLCQRWRNDHPAAPSGIAIIGPGDHAGTLVQHYYDERGVARVYQMAFDGVVWTIWRGGAGVAHQRYTGRLSGDGNRIEGSWASSPDGRGWSHDFDLHYIRPTR